MRKTTLSQAIGMVTIGLMANTHAQIEEVVVTATKRAENAQDVPVAVEAITEESLEQFGISNFTDYLVHLPGVTAGGSGPGQNTVYIRGVASTTPNLTTAGVAGLAPNVALYLDEQPLSQPGRNLDVYAADMSRVEVLSGPQGTLFGASSQAGLMRLITNKPDPTDQYGKLKLGAASTSGGDASNNVEVMYNLPISDGLTVRAVLYRDDQGGYIDNVASTIDLSDSGRFRSAGTVRANGVPVSAGRGGFQAGQDLSNVDFLQADNAEFVEEDFNGVVYEGARVSALFDIAENWELLLGFGTQTIEADGVFSADPELDDYEIASFTDNQLEDSFDNYNWTLTGEFADLEMVYTGAYTSRNTEQTVDYTDYLFVGQYLPYYLCDYSVVYPGAAGPVGTCQAPNLLVDVTSETTVQTHEFRISTDQTASIRATAGLFYSDLELKEFNDFDYANSIYIDGGLGFVDNYAFDTGYRSDAGAFPPGVIFRNDILRTDEQYGIFGEVTFDLSDTLSAILGARYYDVSVDMEGSANSSFCNRALFFTEDMEAYGTDISDLYNGDGEFTDRRDCSGNQTTYTPDTVDANTPAYVVAALNAPDKAHTSGTIFKATLNWRPMDDALYYATFSEGFRPGLLNRPGGASNGQGFTVPFALDTDEVKNYEFGWKTEWLDRTVRFNGSLFFVDISRLQTTIFDPSITNLFFADNAANAEVFGLEGDVVWAPLNIEGLMVNASFSMLDTEITEVLTPTDDVNKGDSLAFAPELQVTLSARYEWPVFENFTAHVMPHASYSDTVYTDIIDINRLELDSWMLLGLTAGVSADEWTLEGYIDNLSDEKAEISGNFNFDRARINYARPRTIGVRMSYSF
ncbi:TonB-dependent receptor [uncultured Umboniibacter sp.]|uniref:TonB-dependent receptor n=1 Tax=uncultured Umboniibacter sp. TaxID=1798917 RepID=UPI00262C537A|nr:TonB-dependent receptor [uncultured Umboniibacter sp.]